ncbi:ABC transporter permease [Natronospora cellulosivora (SeqCode)]
MWFLNINFYTSVLQEGLVYGLMALGVYLTFRILDFPDLTVEGSFPMGAAVSARLIVLGQDPFLATFIAFLAGCIAGVMTGFINTKLKIAGLLASILTMTSLYSINLRIMGSPVISLFRQRRVFDLISNFVNSRYTILITFLIIVIIIKFILDYFLHTELGMALRATGDNSIMVEALGVNTDRVKILGLAIANGLAALSGALVAQQVQSADAQMGVGMIVIGLASVIIGEVFVRTSRIPYATLGVIIGSVVYRMAIAVALRLGFNATDLKIVTAAIVILALGAPSIRKFMIQDEFAEHLMEEGETSA